MKFVGGVTYGPNTFTFPQTFTSQVSLTNNSGYNLYASGSAPNYLAGNLGIGTTPVTGYNLLNSGNWTGTTVIYGYASQGTIQSDVTNTSVSYRSVPGTAAAAFTLGTLSHFVAAQGAFGAGSTVTNQYGFICQPSLTGATSNYGFFGNIAVGTGRYNLYIGGTADNYLAGSLGVGAAPATNRNLDIAKSVTGSVNAYSVMQFGTIQSDVTNSSAGFRNLLLTSAASFTLTSYYHYQTAQSTIGAGSVVSNQTGYIADSSLTGATNNYGFYGAIAAGTGRYNLYMAGTASNYLAGDLQLGKVITPSGTTGAQTINTTTGAVNFAAAATSLVVTNSLVTTNSVIIATVASNDVTMKSVQVVAAAGSFTIYANVAATATTRVNFLITN